MKAMCVKCGLEMTTIIIGVYVVEMAGDRAYKTWPADEQACRSCGSKVIASWGAARHSHEDGFEVALVNMLKKEPGKIRICWEHQHQVKPTEEGITYLLEKYDS